VILLIAGGLFGRSLGRLMSVGPGFMRRTASRRSRSMCRRRAPSRFSSSRTTPCVLQVRFLSALGKRIYKTGPIGEWTVVGVVGDVRRS
jgi:hypothetical protein